ncbi:MAG: hypothetical protein ACTSSI_16935, partial [Candidatus Helarchaeota archaeon]
NDKTIYLVNFNLYPNIFTWEIDIERFLEIKTGFYYNILLVYTTDSSPPRPIDCSPVLFPSLTESQFNSLSNDTDVILFLVSSYYSLQNIHGLNYSEVF